MCTLLIVDIPVRCRLQHRILGFHHQPWSHITAQMISWSSLKMLQKCMFHSVRDNYLLSKIILHVLHVLYAITTKDFKNIIPKNWFNQGCGSGSVCQNRVWSGSGFKIWSDPDPVWTLRFNIPLKFAVFDQSDNTVLKYQLYWI